MKQMRIFLWALAAGLVLPWVALRAQESPKDTAKGIAEWVTDLDADDFFTRKIATERLIAAGKETIPALEVMLQGNSLEATSRCIHILQELALSNDEATEDASRARLQKLKDERFGSIARRAATALSTLNELRRERALDDLEKLGALLLKTEVSNGFERMSTVTGITLGSDFRGQPNDLRRLTWIDIPHFQVILQGPQATDAWLKYLPEMPSLKSLQIKRAAVTAEGLKLLPKLGRLTEFAIFYSPLTDDIGEHLEACRGLAELKLYGTKITRARIDRLQGALIATKIDFRSGGFLGVGGQQTAFGCQVSLVDRESAAGKAGIQVGDTIVRIGEKKVADFDSLTVIVSAISAGESVELEILRGEETFKEKVTLGEWK